MKYCWSKMASWLRSDSPGVFEAGSGCLAQVDDGRPFGQVYISKTRELLRWQPLLSVDEARKRLTEPVL